MIKNDIEVFDERKSYVMTIGVKSYYPNEWASSKKEMAAFKNISEHTINFTLLVPESNNHYFQGLVFFNTLQIKVNNENKLEINLKDQSKLRMSITRKMVDDIYDVSEEGKNDVFLYPTLETSFENFSVESMKEFYNFISNIEEVLHNELTYPIDRIKDVEEKEILNKAILNQFKTEFQSELINFLDKLQNQKFEDMGHPSFQNEAKKLFQILQEVEKPYYTKKMHDELQDNLVNNNTSGSKKMKL